MILCLDCGNTRLKWGLHENGEWLASGALLLDEIGELRQRLPPDRKPLSIIGCNVAGAGRAGQIEAALSSPVRWISASERQCDVVNAYDNPGSLGADRWAALIGARALHQGDTLVILAGTATTIDVLGADGHHRGGLILPGGDMMALALASGTADLPVASGAYSFAPHNTHDAIASGAIHATLGAIARMFATISQQQFPVCLLSGGASRSLLDHFELPVRRIEHLVLDGLARIAAAPHPA